MPIDEQIVPATELAEDRAAMIRDHLRDAIVDRRLAQPKFVHPLALSGKAGKKGFAIHLAVLVQR